VPNLKYLEKQRKKRYCGFLLPKKLATQKNSPPLWHYLIKTVRYPQAKRIIHLKNPHESINIFNISRTAGPFALPMFFRKIGFGFRQLK